MVTGAGASGAGCLLSQEQLAALQSKLTGMERLQVKDPPSQEHPRARASLAAWVSWLLPLGKDKLDDQLKDASLSQADSVPRQLMIWRTGVLQTLKPVARDVQVHAVKASGYSSQVHDGGFLYLLSRHRAPWLRSPGRSLKSSSPRRSRRPDRRRERARDPACC